jgi:hypothetical protein
MVHISKRLTENTCGKKNLIASPSFPSPSSKASLLLGKLIQKGILGSSSQALKRNRTGVVGPTMS